MATSSQWPPQSEPVTPLAVVGRLSELAYSAAEYRLVVHTRAHALVERGDAFFVIDLTDGHELTWFDSEESAWIAWAVIKRRDEQKGGQS